MDEIKQSEMVHRYDHFPKSLATLILAIGQIWGFTTWTVPIAATVVAVEAFLAACLGVGSIKYKLLNAPDAELAKEDEPEG